VKAGIRDYGLALLAGLVVLGFLAGLGSALWDVANQRGFARAYWLPVGLVTAAVIAGWAWRRTVWGRPDSTE
jgi:hypothetical protein